MIVLQTEAFVGSIRMQLPNMHMVGHVATRLLQPMPCPEYEWLAIDEDGTHEGLLEHLGNESGPRPWAFTLDELLTLMVAAQQSLCDEGRLLMLGDKTFCWLMGEKDDEVYIGVPQCWGRSDGDEWMLSAWTADARNPRAGSTFLYPWRETAVSRVPTRFSRSPALRVLEGEPWKPDWLWRS